MQHLLLPAQAWLDAQRFDQPRWHLEGWQDQKARHIQLHIAKAVGKVVAAYGTGEAWCPTDRRLCGSATKSCRIWLFIGVS
jgi:hypothetical protein